MEARTAVPDPARLRAPDASAESAPRSAPSAAEAELRPPGVEADSAAPSDGGSPRDDEAFEALIDRVLSYHSSANLDRLREAYEVACEAHAGQRRYSGLPYISHPVAVALLLAHLNLDVDTIVTALLHDTVEDTVVDLADVQTRFGPEVADLVDGVTKLAQVSMARGGSKQGENLQKLVLAISRDVRVLLVKLADRLHNMRTLGFIPRPDKRERIARETGCSAGAPSSRTWRSAASIRRPTSRSRGG